MQKQHILVIKHSALGDFILATGPFKSIRHHHPDAHITLLTTKAYEGFAKASGYFDDIWLDQRPRPWHLIKIFKLRKRLISGHFDRVYDLQTSTRSSCYFSLFPADKKPEWSGISKNASHRHDSPRRIHMHTIDRQREQLNIAGISEIFPPDISWLSADMGRLNLPKRTALLIPGGAPHRPQKRWAPEGYAELGKWLTQRNITPVIIGTQAEAEVLDRITELCPSAINLCNQTSFAEIASIARQSQLIVGNDTGPMHIAAATRTPFLVLFSADSNPALCAPRGNKCDLIQVDNLQHLPIESVIPRAAALLVP